MKQKLYQAIASTLQAYKTCVEKGNKDWEIKHKSVLITIEGLYLPSGSGIDSGTEIDLDKSTSNRLVFTFGYHHMNDGGYYDGWTEHKLIVTPSLTNDYEMKITGRDRNQIKDSLYDTYRQALDQEVEI